MNLNVNDIIAMIIIVGILTIWTIQGILKLNIPGEINGTLISAFMLVVQYYFRKKPPINKGGINK